MNEQLQEGFCSDKISLDAFRLWFLEKYQTELDAFHFQRGLCNCVKLIEGKGIPKSYLTPRKLFCAGKPLNSFAIDFNAIHESAENIANIYGGEAARGIGGVKWCTSALRLYKEEKYPVVRRERCAMKPAEREEGRDSTVGVVEVIKIDIGC